MPKRVIELFAIDILIALDKISRYHKEHTNAQSFYYDEKSFDATMRELQVVGEATKHLIHYEKLNSKYRIIVDFRNLIVHEYFGIDADEIWDILHTELPRFEKVIYSILQTFDTLLLLEIITASKEDYRGETVLFLERLYDKVELLHTANKIKTSAKEEYDDMEGTLGDE